MFSQGTESFFLHVRLFNLFVKIVNLFRQTDSSGLEGNIYQTETLRE